MRSLGLHEAGEEAKHIRANPMHIAAASEREQELLLEVERQKTINQELELIIARGGGTVGEDSDGAGGVRREGTL